jgi:hypothetical protein
MRKRKKRKSDWVDAPTFFGAFYFLFDNATILRMVLSSPLQYRVV